MRLIALLTLLTVGAVGQRSIDSVDWGSPRVQSMVAVLTVAWDAYAAECYADSTYTIWTGWMEEPIVEVKTQKEADEFYLTWKKRGTWTHRTPILPGFIEFLRRQR